MWSHHYDWDPELLNLDGLCDTISNLYLNTKSFRSIPYIEAYFTLRMALVPLSRTPIKSMPIRSVGTRDIVPATHGVSILMRDSVIPVCESLTRVLVIPRKSVLHLKREKGL